MKWRDDSGKLSSLEVTCLKQENHNAVKMPMEHPIFAWATTTSSAKRYCSGTLGAMHPRHANTGTTACIASALLGVRMSLCKMKPPTSWHKGPPPSVTSKYTHTHTHRASHLVASLVPRTHSGHWATGQVDAFIIWSFPHLAAPHHITAEFVLTSISPSSTTEQEMDKLPKEEAICACCNVAWFFIRTLLLARSNSTCHSAMSSG